MLFMGKFRIESTRLRDWDYSSPAWYFVTICTGNRKCWLGEVTSSGMECSRLGEYVNQHWSEIPDHYTSVKLDEYVVMPNHLHGIIIIEGEHSFTPQPKRAQYRTLGLVPPRPGSLSAIVRSFKAGVTRGSSQGHRDFRWQPGFYDHIIRGNANLKAVRKYIRQNPENWMYDEFYPPRTKT